MNQTTRKRRARAGTNWHGAYQGSHGHRPRGRGQWGFYPNQSAGNPEDIFWAQPNQTHTEASKEANRHFSARGIYNYQTAP